MVLVNPACASPIDSRTGLLQGTRLGDRCCGLDEVVLDADTNAARNILARLYDDGITLVFTKNRQRLMVHDVGRALFDEGGRVGGRWGGAAVGRARQGAQLASRAASKRSSKGRAR